MHVRHSRAASLLAASVLALGTAAVAGTAPAAQAAEPGSPLRLRAPDRLTAYSYDGQVYTDLGVKLIAPEEPFELWSTRSSYDDPIVTEWRDGNGPVKTLHEGAMTSFSGLADFLHITITRVSTGKVAAEWDQGACLNGYSQRVSPDAPPRSPYPYSCPWNPYTLGSVMGIQAGHASSVIQDYGMALTLKPGTYDVVSSIQPVFRSELGISDEDATAVTRMTVVEETYERPAAPQDPRVAQPAAREPRGDGGGRRVPGDPQPDLRSLPAFDISLNRKGTVLRFAATVWNGGDSPLVVDGFRADGEDTMDAYQYFFDADGNQTGYQSVGEMRWHAENHQHWHFEDFAQYRLLDEDLSEVVLSEKQSFCLANTDAVDYTVPGADWRPENTDLGTACGGFDALSIREVLSAGSGDTYSQYRAGQAFRIKTLPNGIYYVAVQANPEFDGVRHLVESDYANNDSVRKIRIFGKPDKRKVEVFQVGIIDESMPMWMRSALR